MLQKPKFFMMVGLPASGKSTEAKILSQLYSAEIFSSDEIRKELFNNVSNQDDNEEVFKTLHLRVKECLAKDKNCIYDATNINWKRRKAFLTEINKYNPEKIAIVCALPVAYCVKRNNERKVKVPNEVIKKMYDNFTVPYWYEGWDDIRIVYTSKYGEEHKYKTKSFIDGHWHTNQNNSHHELTLGKHCLYTALWANKLYNNIYKGYGTHYTNTPLYFAACLHDLGKVSTKTYVNKRGETTEDAHYYNHQNVGCYNSLFFDFGSINPIDVAVLILWHMQPYFNKEEKTKLKYEKLWKPELTKLIYILHEADMRAH